MAAYAHLGPRGAYAYVKSDRAKEALTLLERVASLLSFVNEQNDDMRRLAVEGHSELQSQVIQLQQKVLELREKLGRDRFGNISAAEREAQLELDAVVFSVRKLPGFSSFALPAGWADVQAAAAETPLVFIAPTDKGTPIIVVLPGAQKVSQFIVPATCAEIGAAAKDFFQREFRSNQGSSFAALTSMLEWLGGHLMSIVKLMLLDCGIKDGTPITVVPFDLLALLPIHSAFAQLPGPEPRSVRIHYLFHPRDISYAYSAHVLAECQRRSKQAGQLQALVVNNPRPLPAAYDPLIFSDEESAVVSSHFPTLEISGLAATTERVMEDLPRAGLIHFSCHGDVDRRVGNAGVLLLANGAELNIEHLLSLPSFSPRLVVLSACRSGAVAMGQPQASGLVSGFLAAGAAAVLGTFWHTDELATLLLMSRFYELWADGCRTPVTALGAAQEWLMTAPAEELRGRLRPQVLLDEAAKDLVSAPAAVCPYIHPWFWSGFFVAGV
jgi:CHAT domain